MNQFKRAWEDIKEDKKPVRARNIREIDWKEFDRKTWEGSDYFADTVVGSLMLGDILVFKEAFSKDFMSRAKENFIKWTSERPSSFHKMLEGVPDFHRKIDMEAGKKYVFSTCRHSAYFFRFNNDPLNLWPTIGDRWRTIKLAIGLDPDEWVKNTPIDGIVDRIQICRYPPKLGYFVPHHDPDENQRTFISIYPSKKGIDYDGGGCYALGLDDRKIDLDAQVDIGDIAIGYATVVHGVDPCDGEFSWDKHDGRWFIGLYSANTDHVQNRATGKPAKI